MKHKKNSHYEIPTGKELASNNDVSSNENNFMPFPEEIARKAYFAYVNAGSLQGHEVQHWLDAEAWLIKERDRNRVHGFRN
jgi:hypothetical protein